MPDRIVLLGAEKQAATSAALAYPERQFRFVSDQPVLDGWNLPNVTFTYGTPGKVQLEPGEQAVALCPRWLPVERQRQFCASRALAELHERGIVPVLPVSPTPIPGKACVVKGDRWHRPDGTIVGTDLDPTDVSDPYGCGTLYQAHWPAEQNLLAVGFLKAGRCQIALIRVHSESCARDDILAAGETVEDDFVLTRSTAAVMILRHDGPFTLNWLKRGPKYRLTSFRPAPRAVFGTLRKAGIDLLAKDVDQSWAAPSGHKFVVDITYTSYLWLVT